MSEGTAPAAPTNGSTAPTTPAPGVAPVSTPKSGEGAVTPSAPTWTPIERELQFNDGTKKKYRFESQEELDRHLYNSAGFDKAQKKALELERKLKAEEAADEEALLRSRGKDPDAYFAKRLEAEIARQYMTAEQRQQADASEKMKALEARNQVLERAMKAEWQKKQDEKQWTERAPLIRDALIAAEVTEVDDDFAADLEWAEKKLQKLGVPWDAKTHVAEALDRRKQGKEAWLGSLKPEAFLSLGKSAIHKLPAEAIYKTLTPEQQKAIGQLQADEFKANNGLSSVPIAPAPKPEKPKEYMTPEQWKNRPR